MKNANIANGDTLADEVDVNLNVLRALMLHGIGGEVDCADVVVVDEGGMSEGVMELMKKLTELGSFNHAICDSVILNLNAGVGDNAWSLQGQGDEVGV
jgi:nucleoside-triphosphatase THEP1